MSRCDDALTFDLYFVDCGLEPRSGLRLVPLQPWDAADKAALQLSSLVFWFGENMGRAAAVICVHALVSILLFPSKDEQPCLELRPMFQSRRR
jgi:hypothetical protein